MRPKLTYANVVSTLCLFMLLAGGVAYAATHLGKNSVGSKQLKKNAVTTAKVEKEAITAAKVKKGTLTGTQINVSTLGTVPSANTAQTAQTANALSTPEPWHEVGAPGEPVFQNTWQNSASTIAPSVAFYKDHEEIVHLRGFTTGGSQKEIFQLPPGFRPFSAAKVMEVPVICGGPGDCADGMGSLIVNGGGYGAGSGDVFAPLNANLVGLEGVAFRAES